MSSRLRTIRKRRPKNAAPTPAEIHLDYRTEMDREAEQLAEEENPIWSKDANWSGEQPNGQWMETWDDPYVKGVSVSERCMNPLDVDRWIAYAFKKCFNERTHELVFEFPEQRWFYREGD
jgi:hypothetical protein